MPKKTLYDTVMLGGYVPTDEFDLIDAYAKRLQERSPGKKITRVAALRRLYTIGLKHEGMLSESVLAGEKSGAS